MKKLLFIAFLFSSLFSFSQEELNRGTVSIDANGKVTSGDVTNNTQIDKTNGILLHGTATQWSDLATSAIQTRVGVNNLPEFSYDSLALEFVSDADSSERAYYVIQTMHNIKQQSKISPHVHWIQHNAGDTTWNMKLKYRIHPIGKQGGQWKWIKTYKKSEVAFTTAPHHNVAEFPDITLTGCAESSIIDFVLYRYDAVGLATVYAKSFDIHVEIEKLGTIDEYPAIP